MEFINFSCCRIHFLRHCLKFIYLLSKVIDIVVRLNLKDLVDQIMISSLCIYLLLELIAALVVGS